MGKARTRAWLASDVGAPARHEDLIGGRDVEAPIGGPVGRRRLRTDRGAAAVEFALVSLVLVPLVLGMIQYGLFFNDSLQTRQATRHAAREGVVWASTISSGDCTTGSDAARLACRALSQVSPVTGKRAVMVKAAGATWTRGTALLVCAVVHSAGDSVGIVPVPHAGMIRSVTAMDIEKDSTSTPGFTDPGGFGTPVVASDSGFASLANDPSGGSWGWCS